MRQDILLKCLFVFACLVSQSSANADEKTFRDLDLATKKSPGRNEELRLAAFTGDLTKVKEIMFQKNSDPFDYTAMMFAANTCQLPVIQALMKYAISKSNKLAGIYYGLGPSIYFKCKEGVEYFLEQDAESLMKVSNDCYERAAEFGNIEIMKLLLEKSPFDPSANENQALVNAIQFGHSEIVKLLLTRPEVDPSASSNLLIKSVSESGNVELVEKLLKDKRVDPSANNNAAIKVASSNNHIEVVKMLMSDDRVKTFVGLVAASQAGHRSVVEEIMKGEKALQITKDEIDPIRFVATSGRIDILERLLQNSDIVKNSKVTVAMLAAKNKMNYGIMAKLLPHCAVRDDVEEEKMSPVNIATTLRYDKKNQQLKIQWTGVSDDTLENGNVAYITLKPESASPVSGIILDIPDVTKNEVVVDLSLLRGHSCWKVDWMNSKQVWTATGKSTHFCMETALKNVRLQANRKTITWDSLEKILPELNFSAKVQYGSVVLAKIPSIKSTATVTFDAPVGELESNIELITKSGDLVVVAEKGSILKHMNEPDSGATNGGNGSSGGDSSGQSPETKVKGMSEQSDGGEKPNLSLVTNTLCFALIGIFGSLLF